VEVVCGAKPGPTSPDVTVPPNLGEGVQQNNEDEATGEKQSNSQISSEIQVSVSEQVLMMMMKLMMMIVMMMIVVVVVMVMMKEMMMIAVMARQNQSMLIS